MKKQLNIIALLYIIFRNRISLLFICLLCSFIFSSTSRAQGNRIWATYCGGTNNETGNSVATDAVSNVFLTGQTESTNNISSPGGFQASYGGNIDAFLVKYDASGNRLWGTYYGGIMGDVGNSVAIDAAGNVYLAGYTSNPTGIATPGAFQTTYNGNSDAFLVKFDANGNRLWATYYGGPDIEYGWVVTTDISGNVFLAGYTGSTTGIASPGAFQNTFSGGYDDGFLVKFDSNGNRQWATYYGGTNDDAAKGVAADPSGNVYIAGNTASPAGIALGGFQNTMGSSLDGYLVKFDGNGNRLWATYYGGPSADVGQGVACDPSGNVFLSGWTNSVSGISSGGFQNTFGGGPGPGDAYLVKFDSGGNRIWATYYGGTNAEETGNVAVDPSGNSYLSGESYSPNTGYCVASGGFQDSLIGAFQPFNIENTFVAKFDPNGNRLCATYYGQQHEEYGIATVDGSTGNVYLTALTASPSGIASGGFQNSFGGGSDAYLAKFSPCVTSLNVIASATNILCFGLCTGNGNATPSSGTSPYTYNWSPGGGTSSSATGLCAGNYTVTVTDASSSTATATITITQPAAALTATISSTAATCSGNNGTATVVPNGGTPGYTYSWNPSAQTSQTATGLSAGNYTAIVTDTNGCTQTQTVTVTQPSSITATSTSTPAACGVNNGTATAIGSGGTSPYTYSWSPTGQTTSAATGLAAGTYSATVTDAAGCSSTTTVAVTSTGGPTAGISANVTITSGSSATLTATGGGTYTWSNGESTSPITVTPSGTTIYCVTVTDANNCSDTACVTVFVDNTLDCSTGAEELYLPNAFSPNGDSENDSLGIYFGNRSCIKTFELHIYNRWGEIVFETTDPLIRWDGLYQGKREGTAVFDYYMKAVMVTGKEIIKKGNVSLMR